MGESKIHKMEQRETVGNILSMINIGGNMVAETKEMGV